MGRRLAILLCLCYTAAWIPLWILPKSFGGLSAGAFFVQSGVQGEYSLHFVLLDVVLMVGAWGVVPIYLGEVAPPAFRATFGGLAYQLGNMASSGASQIEADAGSSIKLPNGKPDYATILGILIGAVIAWMMVCVFLGPEADGAHFEQAHVAYQQGAGEMAGKDLVMDHGDHEAKAVVEHAEVAQHTEKGRQGV